MISFNVSCVDVIIMLIHVHACNQELCWCGKVLDVIHPMSSLVCGYKQIGGIQSVNEVMKHMAKDKGGPGGGAIIMLSSTQGLWT